MGNGELLIWLAVIVVLFAIAVLLTRHFEREGRELQEMRLQLDMLSREPKWPDYFPVWDDASTPSPAPAPVADPTASTA